MNTFKCAFSGTLVGEQFGCTHAQRVTRRTGPDVACRSETAHLRCQQLFEHLKAGSLPAFDVEDDPLKMPHSVSLKIQFGGLLGIKKLVGGKELQVEDISRLVDQAQAQFENLDTIPVSDIVDDITSYSVRRRRART